MVKVFPPAPAPAFGAGGKKPPLHGGANPRVSFGGGGDHNNGGNGGGGPVKLDGIEGQLLRQMIASRRGNAGHDDDNDDDDDDDDDDNNNNDDCFVRITKPNHYTNKELKRH